MKVITSDKTKAVSGGCFLANTSAQLIKLIINRAIEHHPLKPGKHPFDIDDANIMLPMHIKK